MIQLSFTQQQFNAQAKKKLGDVVELYQTIEQLKLQHPDLSKFLDAFLTNSQIEIVYNGGSAPGAKRKIIPQSIKPDGSFRAFCVESDASKAFKLEKVTLN